MESTLTDESLRYRNNAPPRKVFFNISRPPYSDRYVAEIQYPTTRLWQRLGTFDTAEEAALACEKAAHVLGGRLFTHLYDRPTGIIPRNPIYYYNVTSLDDAGSTLSDCAAAPATSIRGCLMEAIRMCGEVDRLQRLEVRYPGLTADVNKLRHSSEEPTDYMKPLLADDSLPTKRHFEPHTLVQEAWTALRHSLSTDKLIKQATRHENIPAPSKNCSRNDVNIHCGGNSAQEHRRSNALGVTRVVNFTLGNFELAKPTMDNHDYLNTEPNSCFVGSICYIAPDYGEWMTVTNTNYDHNIGTTTPSWFICSERHITRDPNSPHEIYIEIDDHDQYFPQMHFKECYDQLENNSRRRRRMMMMMSDTSLALGAQAIGAVMSNALTSSSTSSASVCLVESAVVLGLTFTLAGIAMRGKRRALSNWMTKLGAVATASGILLSLGSHLPPAMAWIVGPLAFLIMVVAVSLA